MRTSSWAFAALTIVLATSAARADRRESRVLTWPEIQEQGRLLSGHVEPVDAQGWQSLRLSNVGSAPTRFPLVVFEGLSPPADSFAIEGQLRYQDVEGDAYMEMWTMLPDGRRFFSRTLGEDGSAGKITGTSEWRPFVLPFDLSGESPEQITLEVNAFMPGKGVIDVGPLALANLSPDEAGDGLIWWSEQTGGFIGGILGAAIGLSMTFVAIVSRKGGARKLAIVVLGAVFAVGLVCAVAAIVAGIDEQPFAVCYPLGLAGTFGMMLPAAAHARMRRLWCEIERRKMRALDTQWAANSAGDVRWPVNRCGGPGRMR